MQNFRQRPTNKKTLTNQLNVPGSSDNRRLNTDVVPVISPAWSANPAVTLESAVNLGSRQNPWRNVHASQLYAYTPRIPQAVAINNVAPSGTPDTNGGYYWLIDENTTTPADRIVYRWNGSSWVNYNSQLTPGAIFYAISTSVSVPNVASRRLFVWAGPRSGDMYGLRRSFQLVQV